MSGPSGGTAAAAACWGAALDRLEAGLAVATRAVEDGDLEAAASAVDRGVPTGRLPVMPPACRPRAQHLLDQLLELSGRIEMLRRGVRRDLTMTVRLVPTERAVPRYIDRTS